jgi:hypothetical protein
MSVRVKPWPPGMASGGVSLSPQSFLSSPRRWIAWRASAADGRQATASGVVGALAAVAVCVGLTGREDGS